MGVGMAAVDEAYRGLTSDIAVLRTGLWRLHGSEYLTASSKVVALQRTVKRSTSSAPKHCVPNVAC
jgi:hypothetical protein